LTENSAELVPRQEKQFFIYAAPPYFVNEGTYAVNVFASGARSNETLEIKIKVSRGDTNGKQAANGNKSLGNVTLNISIPTGAVIGGSIFQNAGKGSPQMLAISVLAIGVLIILVLRFIIVMK
jgi:predicted MFS family arabinose efflux permease